MRPLFAQRRLTNFEPAGCRRRVMQTRNLIAAAFTLLSVGSALGGTIRELNPSEESTCAPVLATTVPLYCGFNKTPCADTFAKYFGFREPNNSYVKIGRVDDNLAYPPTC